MNKQFILLCAALIFFTAFLSMIFHYRSTNFNQAAGPTVTSTEYVSSVWDWKAMLVAHPQFAPKAPPPKIEPSVKQGIENSTLIGVVPDTPAAAILVLGSTNTVLRVELGESWIEGWVLTEIGPDHIVWQNEVTKEQFKQDLFDNEQTEALLSSAITN